MFSFHIVWMNFNYRPWGLFAVCVCKCPISSAFNAIQFSCQKKLTELKSFDWDDNLFSVKLPRTANAIGYIGWSRIFDAQPRSIHIWMNNKPKQNSIDPFVRFEWHIRSTICFEWIFEIKLIFWNWFILMDLGWKSPKINSAFFIVVILFLRVNSPSEREEGRRQKQLDNILKTIKMSAINQSDFNYVLKITQSFLVKFRY